MAQAPGIYVENFIHQPADVIKDIPSLHEGLVVGRGVGDLKIIAPAWIPFGKHPVENKSHLGMDVGPESSLGPSGIDLTAGYIFDIVNKK